MRLPMADADGVTIGRCARDTAHADAPARTGHILDNYRLTERCPHMLGEDACEGVRGAARWERHDNGEGARWIDLRARRQRPRSRRAAEQRDELAPLHSITSSTMESTACGTSMFSARAVCKFMTSSNLVDCSTGSSAGFSPLRILPA